MSNPIAPASSKNQLDPASPTAGEKGGTSLIFASSSPPKLTPPALRRSPFHFQGEAFARGWPPLDPFPLGRRWSAKQAILTHSLDEHPRKAPRSVDVAPPRYLYQADALVSPATKPKVVLGTFNPVAPESVKNLLDVAAPTVGTNGGTSSRLLFLAQP